MVDQTLVIFQVERFQPIDQDTPSNREKYTLLDSIELLFDLFVSGMGALVEKDW